MCWKDTDSSFFLGQGPNIVLWAIWDLVLEHPLSSPLTTRSLHTHICTYTHTHNFVMHTQTCTHACTWDVITLNAMSFLECVCFSLTQTLCFAWWKLPTPFHQNHSYLSFCSQLIDQFLWEAFLDHPRKVLVSSRGSPQDHILYNITQRCDYNFPCCFF